jgi:hypothetical protein
MDATVSLRAEDARVYLIVAFTVMTEAPEAAGPLPVAFMEKLSLP